MGAEPYHQKVINSTPIGRALRRMNEKDSASLRIKFNSAYYLAKLERPFSDYPHLLTLQGKNKVQNIGKSYATDRAAGVFTDYIAKDIQNSLIDDLSKASFYSILSDGSTDSSVTEQELVFVLYLLDGVPSTKFLSIESVEHGNAEGIYQSIKKAFERIGILDLSKHVVGLNVDGAAVNTGIHSSVSTMIKSDSPWLQTVHCFNHRLELGVKDCFANTAFEKIDTMLIKLYYLYQISPKRLRELRTVAEALDQCIPKPTKACGTRWINHKYNAMKIVLENYGGFLTHVESLSHTDSNAEKRAELRGFANKWKDASIRRIQDFTWTMIKLQILIENDLDSPDSRLTYYKRFIESTKIVDGKQTYQNIPLKNFKQVNDNVGKHYDETIARLAESIGNRFSDIKASPVFENLVPLLDTKT